MPRILIIEDQPAWLEQLRSTIVAPNITIDPATDINQAISHLEANKYDVVIADLQLSQFDADVFSEFGAMIFALTATGLEQGNRFPIIVVTGTEPDRSVIVRALNSYPGWIWGWHDKRTFAQEAFRNSVNRALEVAHNNSSEHQVRATPEFPGWLRALLTVVGLLCAVTSVVYLFANSSLTGQLQPLLLTMTAVTVILCLLVMMVANPTMIDAIMPWILKALGRESQKDKTVQGS